MNDKEIIEGLPFVIAELDKRMRGLRLNGYNAEAADYERYRNRVKAALTRLQSLQWRPIEEAPPINECLEVIVRQNGKPERVQISKYYDGGICPDTGKNYGVGMIWQGIDEYECRVIAWRPLPVPTAFNQEEG